MGLSEAQKLAIGDMVIEVIEKNAPALDQGGMDSKTATTTLKEQRTEAVSANEEQIRAKTVSKEATARSETATHRYYVSASGFLDMAIAAVVKDSVAAEELRKIRSRVARPPPEEETASAGDLARQ